ncbi:MAG: FHA domain-containing protein [Lachnospiraceae bacterium]|nr:FHA domain-containing protein [Lachnospiraceae bacterium]
MNFCRMENRNYAVDECSEENASRIVIGMLRETRLKRVLPVRLRYVDDRIFAEYDITGLQPLARLYERQPLKAADIENVIDSIYKANAELEENLLRPSDLLLSPEYIFRQADGGEYLFCCRIEKSMEEDPYKALMKFFMDHVDYGDKESVGLAYSAVKAAEGIEAPIKMFALIKDEPHVEEEPGPATEELFEKIPTVRKKRGFFRRKQTKKALLLPEEYAPPAAKPAGVAERFVTKPLEKKLMQLAYRLVPEKNENAQIIEIGFFPFVIGSMREGVDCVLAGEGISRLHAKMEKSDEGISVEDLNSSNGTYVNGEVIFGKGKVMLSDGDHITFAGSEYRLEIYGRI